MGAVWYHLERTLHHERRTMVGLALLVAVSTTAPLVVAAGAQRTASSPDRYAASQQSVSDTVVVQDAGLPRRDEVAVLPAVAAVDAATFVFAGLTEPDTGTALDVLVFGGSAGGLGYRIVAGREPDPATSREFVATERFLGMAGASIGDSFVLVSITQQQADLAGFISGVNDGPSFPATLVGVIDGATEGDPTSEPPALAVFGAGLLDEPDIGVATTLMALERASGVGLAELRGQLDGLPGGSSLVAEEAVPVNDSVRSAVRTQARGLWTLAWMSAIAVVAVVGQLLSRRLRMPVAERAGLLAMGTTAAQIRAGSILRVVVPILAGSASAIGVAWASSAVFPIGFVRRLEPDPGLRLELAPVVGGAAVMALALTGWCAASLAQVRTRRGADSGSLIVDQVAARMPMVTASTGLRFAFTRGARDIGSVRTSSAGLGLTIIGLGAALTFGSSMDRLTADPARFGFDYDLSIGSGATVVSDELRESLDADPDIAGLTLLAVGQARIGAESLWLVGMDPVRGDVFPRVLAGRLPVSEDEIALGRQAADRAEVGIGDEFEVNGAESRTMRVTGLVVVPSIGSNDGLGEDGVVTMDVLTRFDPAASAATAVFDLRPGAPPGTADRILGANGAADMGGFDTPTPIRNVTRIRVVPYLLAVLLVALAVLTVAHLMICSMHNRRRDLAVVRSLGADRRWLARVVYWQATTFLVLPLVVGIPLGLVAGRLIFRVFADSLGVVNSASFPWLWVTLGAVGLVLLGNVVAAVPARRSRRVAPSALLRAE